MSNKNGFTLIEVLFVLAVWSVLMLLSAPLNVSVLEKHAEEKFLETLQMDILYMQNLSYGSRDNYSLVFQDGGYVVKKIHSSEFWVEREIPD
ncbi:type II secretion system protein [Virgibacillus doumboii]|uniref:type II secretion system protein n=1 Tax=Virgibacillus doumboii TaxID=2697503 RepID=UPI0013DFD1D5|nr:type II secretion system protein [Virgibacillus doumboii]